MEEQSPNLTTETPEVAETTVETNQNQQSAAELLIERLADYDANLERYQKRFETFAPKKEKLNMQIKKS